MKGSAPAALVYVCLSIALSLSLSPAAVNKGLKWTIRANTLILNLLRTHPPACCTRPKPWTAQGALLDQLGSLREGMPRTHSTLIFKP